MQLVVNSSPSLSLHFLFISCLTLNSKYITFDAASWLCTSMFPCKLPSIQNAYIHTYSSFPFGEKYVSFSGEKCRRQYQVVNVIQGAALPEIHASNPYLVAKRAHNTRTWNNQGILTPIIVLFTLHLKALSSNLALSQGLYLKNLPSVARRKNI